MERLQKVLAQAGIASRRAAEQIISAGRVRVDGKIVRELGTQVDPRKHRVEVDGNKIVAEKLIYIVLHKPRGVVCTLSDPEGRPTIHELLKDAGARVVPVGRLDFHTSGALLCTNDGEFAQALAHPKKAVPKVYVAKVKGAVDDEALERFSQRIVIDGRPTQPAHVKRLRFEGDKTWLEITLREGRNRQVRRLGEATGFPVMRLARISHAGVTSEDLRPGQWRPLSVDELVDLKRDYGVPKKVRAPLFEPAQGKGGWSDAPRVPGARRPDPKFSAAKRRDAKGSSRKGPAPKYPDSLTSEPARFDRKRGRDEAVAAPARFDRKRGRDEAAAPARFDRKRGRDESAAPARFDRKRGRDESAAAPARFDRKRGRDESAAAPARFDRERGRDESAAAPARFDRKRAARSEREGGAAPARGAARATAKRPWLAAPRDDRPGAGSSRAAATRPSSPQQRGARPAPAAPFSAKHREQKRFNAKNAEPQPSASKAPGKAAPRAAGASSRGRSDARGSAPRRGTSR